MVHGGVGLGAEFLHGLQPVHQVAYVVIVRAERGRRRSSGNMNNFLAVFLGANDRQTLVDRSIVEGVKLLPAAFARDSKQRSAPSPP